MGAGQVTVKAHRRRVAAGLGAVVCLAGAMLANVTTAAVSVAASNGRHVAALAPPAQLAQFAGPGAGTGQLASPPTGIDVGPDGDVYVSAGGPAPAGEVEVFDDHGNSVRRFSTGQTGYDLAIGPDGNVLVLQRNYTFSDQDGFRNHSIVATYSPLGVSAGTFNAGESLGRGLFARADGHVFMATEQQPVDCGAGTCLLGVAGWLDINPTTSAITGHIAPVGDDIAATSNWVYTLVPSQDEVRGIQLDGPDDLFLPTGGDNPTSIDLDAAGNLYVALAGTNEVRVFSPSGTLLTHWASPNAYRIAVAPTGVVYVLGSDSYVRAYAFGLTGTVADENADAPLADVLVVAVSSTGMVAGTTRTDASGEYRLPVGPGQYRVLFIDPSGNHLGEWAWGHAQDDPTAAASVTVGPTGSKVDIGLLPARGSVTGAVAADGSGDPVPNAWVGALNLTTGTLQGTEADGSGAYALSGVDARDHLIMFVDPSGQHRFEFYDDQLFAPTAAHVPITAGTTRTANASLAAYPAPGSGSTISGTITADVGGAPIPGAWVVAVRADGTVSGGAVADPSGHYSISLGAGSYRVEVLDPAGIHTGEWETDRPLDDYDGAQVYAVGAADDITVDAGLASNRGAITGIVSDPGGPAEGDEVIAFSLTHGGVAGVATTAADGTYALEGLLPAEYLVAALDPTGAHGFVYFNGTTNPSAATPVAVSAGSSAPANLSLG